MKKIIYWLKKLGILRTGIFKAKGDAKKVVEMEIKGELYQSDKEIEKEAEKKAKGDSKKIVSKESKGKVGKIFFWIFVVLGLFFLLAFLSKGLIWTAIGIVFWAYFLNWTWKHIKSGSLAIGKMFVFGAVIFVISIIIIGSPKKDEKSIDTGSEEEAVNDLHDAYLEEGVEDDEIVNFLLELKEGTKINFSRIQNDKISWPAQNVTLDLQKGKSFTAEDLSPKDFDRIQEYFTDKGADDGGVGFKFNGIEGKKTAGFALRRNPYKGMMCILVGIDNEGVLIGCGWGPTDNPNSKMDD